MSTVTAVPIAPVRRAYLLWLWIGLALAMVAGVALARAGDTGIVATPSGLRYKVIAPGTGPRPTDSDVALVKYKGSLTDGTVFDQSPQPVPLPVAAVVPGFSEALKLMPKGAKYRIWIPSKLGYGASDNGPIPGNSTLVFDVEMFGFLPEATVRAMQQQQMMMGGGAPGGVPGQPMPGQPMPGGR